MIAGLRWRQDSSKSPKAVPAAGATTAIEVRVRGFTATSDGVQFAPQAVASGTVQEPSPRTREWVERLRLPLARGRLTVESALEWDELRARLIAAGPEAVPAIREFLSKNAGEVWDTDARRVLGYESSRVAFFEVLRQIGGTEAEAALVSTLEETIEPREIALLARELETLAPGQYRLAAVEAANRSLAAIGSGVPAGPDEAGAPSTEVAPLFEVLHRFGGTTVVADLEAAAARWNYYGTISLAQLPDGAGVSSLVRLASQRDSAGPAADAATRMLASLAIEHQEARDSFLELVRNNRVATNTWSQLAPILAGAQLQFVAGVLGRDPPLDHGAGAQRIHLSHGNQNFWLGMPAVAAPAEHWERQLAWLDELSAVVTDSAAQAAIQEAWKLILLRLGPLTATVP